MSLKYETIFNWNSYLTHYRHGKKHRENGPAMIYDENLSWYEYGSSHRLDGASVMVMDMPDGYYIRGKRYTREEYESKIRSLS